MRALEGWGRGCTTLGTRICTAPKILVRFIWEYTKLLGDPLLWKSLVQRKPTQDFVYGAPQFWKAPSGPITSVPDVTGGAVVGARFGQCLCESEGMLSDKRWSFCRSIVAAVGLVISHKHKLNLKHKCISGCRSSTRRCETLFRMSRR